MKSESIAQSCVTLRDPVDCSLPSFSVHGISWENTGMGSHSLLPNPGIESRSSTLQADSLPPEPPGKPQESWSGYPFPSLGDLPDPGVRS